LLKQGATEQPAEAGKHSEAGGSGMEKHGGRCHSRESGNPGITSTYKIDHFLLMELDFF